VVTPPERRRGRGGAPTPTPPGAAAASLGIPVLATADVNAPEAVARLRAARPRLLVVVAFGQILRRAVREVAPLGVVNLHFSLLPRWRGAAPVQRAILAGDRVTGVCLQRLVARLDAGPVLASREVVIGPRDDTPALHDRLTVVGAALLHEVVERVLAGDPPPERPQDESRATYAPRVEREEGDLDLGRESAEEADRRVRALEPWPRCRGLLRRADGAGTEVVVREARPEPRGSGTAPCTVLAADAAGLVVAAREGALRVTRLQRAGGRPLDAAAFLNGWPVAAGDQLLPPSSATSAS